MTAWLRTLTYNRFAAHIFSCFGGPVLGKNEWLTFERWIFNLSKMFVRPVVSRQGRTNCSFGGSFVQLLSEHHTDTLGSSEWSVPRTFDVCRCRCVLMLFLDGLINFFCSVWNWYIFYFFISFHSSSTSARFAHVGPWRMFSSIIIRFNYIRPLSGCVCFNNPKQRHRVICWFVCCLFFSSSQ